MLQTAMVIGVICILVWITFIDLKEHRISNLSIFLLLLCGFPLSVLLFPELLLTDRMLGLWILSVPMLLVSIIKPGSFGGGDIKLMMTEGWLMGRRAVVEAATVAILTSACYAIFALALKKKERKDHFALGPFLCLGIAAILLTRI